MRPTHYRMPVIIEPRDYDRWFDAGDPARPPVDLIRPYPCRKDACLAGERPGGKCAKQRSCAFGAFGLNRACWSDLGCLLETRTVGWSSLGVYPNRHSYRQTTERMSSTWRKYDRWKDQ